MKKAIKLGVVVLSLSALTSLTYAATPGTYVGAGIGAGKLETSDNNNYYNVLNQNNFDSANKEGAGLTNFSTSNSNTNVAGRVFAGYNLNEFIGVEAGFGAFSNAKYKSSADILQGSVKGNVKSNVTNSLYDVDLVAKAYLPVGNGFNLYALGGGAYVMSEVKTDTTISATNGSDTQSNTDSNSQKTNKLRPKFGIGASWDIPQTNFTASVEASRIQGTGNVKTSNTAIPNTDMLTVNFAYNFG